jgi:anthranilate phosphoribosyltransferase
MKELLHHLFEHKTLSRQESYRILLDISEGAINEHALSAFMTVFLMRSITLPELVGFRDALLERCIPFPVEDRAVVDVVGTGGDGKNTFNISTLSCFIIAGAGVPVAKHGNYGASTISGASNLMENIGYVFKNNTGALLKELDEAGMCFLHAPLFHPSLKNVAPIRKNLKVRTFFNMLGPLVNPAKPTYQLVGVYNLEMARIYNYIFQQENKQYTLVHSFDGYDEVSLTSDVKVIKPAGEYTLSPTDFGYTTIDGNAISGGQTTQEAAALFLRILKGEGTPAQNNVVIANAALGLQMANPNASLEDAVAASTESLNSGKAFGVLKKLLSLQK